MLFSSPLNIYIMLNNYNIDNKTYVANAHY